MPQPHIFEKRHTTQFYDTIEKLYTILHYNDTLR